jgi:hypothetical protein
VTPCAPAFGARRFGCWVPASSSGDSFAELERVLGRPWDVFSTFIDFDSQWPGEPGAHRPRLDVQRAAASGHELAVAFGPTRWATRVHFADVVAGRYDERLVGWFSYLGSLGVPVVIRWAWEMNMGSAPWSPLAAHDRVTQPRCRCADAGEYVTTWRYVVDLQRRTRVPAAAGACGAAAVAHWRGRAGWAGDDVGLGDSGTVPSLRWLWCPGAQDIPAGPGQAALAMEDFYPGSGWVDVVGYDTYNGYGRWASASDTIRGVSDRGQGSAYERVSRLHRTAPVWIGETGCVEAAAGTASPPARPGARTKAAWWTELFAGGPPLDRLECICFFDADGRPATRDWRLDSSPGSWAAFVAGFSGL